MKQRDNVYEYSNFLFYYSSCYISFFFIIQLNNINLELGKYVGY